MNGQNKRKFLLLSNIMLVGFYFIIITYIAYEYMTYSSNYEAIQKEYIESLNLDLEELIKDPFNLDTDKILELRKKKPFDVILQTKEKVLFQTVDLSYKQNYINSINPEIVAYQHQGYSNNNEVMKWSVIYKVTNTQYTQIFLFQQNILFSIMFLVLLTFIYVIQFFLFKPINRLVKSIQKANEQGDIVFEVTEDDSLNKNINNFMSNLKEKIDYFNQEYTDLEIQLQYEKELLNNTFLVSKALIHELKSPVHALMLENQLFNKNHQPNTAVTTITGINEDRIDSILQDLNMTLRVMNDGHLQVLISEEFDVVPLLQESIRLFRSMIDTNDLYVDLIVSTNLIIIQKLIYFKLLVHNMFSNTFQYATKETEVTVEAYIEMDNIVLEVTNSLSPDNLKRMQLSQNIFYNIPNNKYSSGHGLFLIKDLASLMGGSQEIYERDGRVTVKVSLPIEKQT